ncbi:uncharacterized protein DS421_9g273930 [Arachis hypogaea]|nr:uncharacterized protein DS421_9g273930 [Arachis hypogaea]
MMAVALEEMMAVARTEGNKRRERGAAMVELELALFCERERTRDTVAVFYWFSVKKRGEEGEGSYDG